MVIKTNQQEFNIADVLHDEAAMKILAEILQRKIAVGCILGFWESSPETGEI